MKQFIACAFLVLVVPAVAQTATPHLQSCPTGDSGCALGAKQFETNYAKAWRRDYTSQRNVAYMLSGARSGVKPDGIASCAWRTVIINSGSKSVDDSDRSNLSSACRDLTQPQRVAAVAMASEIMSKIYKKGLEVGFRLP